MVNLVKGRTINGAVYIDTKKLIIDSGAILSPPRPTRWCLQNSSAETFNRTEMRHTKPS